MWIDKTSYQVQDAVVYFPVVQVIRQVHHEAASFVEIDNASHQPLEKARALDCGATMSIISLFMEPNLESGLNHETGHSPRPPNLLPQHEINGLRAFFCISLAPLPTETTWRGDTHQQGAHDYVLNLGVVSPDYVVGIPDKMGLQGGAQGAVRITLDEHADCQDRLCGLDVDQIHAQVLGAVGEGEKRGPEERIDVVLCECQVDAGVYGEQVIAEGGEMSQRILVAQLEHGPGNFERGGRVVVRQGRLYRCRLVRIGLAGGGGGRDRDDASLLQDPSGLVQGVDEGDGVGAARRIGAGRLAPAASQRGSEVGRRAAEALGGGLDVVADLSHAGEELAEVLLSGAGQVCRRAVLPGCRICAPGGCRTLSAIPSLGICSWIWGM